jgi:hypothetical protein
MKHQRQNKSVSESDSKVDSQSLKAKTTPVRGPLLKQQRRILVTLATLLLHKSYSALEYSEDRSSPLTNKSLLDAKSLVLSGTTTERTAAASPTPLLQL